MNCKSESLAPPPLAVIYDDMAQSPKDYKFEGEDYVIMSQNEILTIIKD